MTNINPSPEDIKDARICELTERAAEIPLLRAGLAAVTDAAKREIAKLIGINEALTKSNVNLSKQLSEMNSRSIDNSVLYETAKTEIDTLKGVIEDKEKDIEALKHQLELANKKSPIGSAESYRDESLRRGKRIIEQAEAFINLEKTCDDYRDEVYEKNKRITELESENLRLKAIIENN